MSIPTYTEWLKTNPGKSLQDYEAWKRAQTDKNWSDLLDGREYNKLKKPEREALQTQINPNRKTAIYQSGTAGSGQFTTPVMSAPSLYATDITGNQLLDPRTKKPILNEVYNTSKFQDAMAGVAIGNQVAAGSNDPFFRLGAVAGAAIAGLFTNDLAGYQLHMQAQQMAQQENQQALAQTAAGLRVASQGVKFERDKIRLGIETFSANNKQVVAAQKDAQFKIDSAVKMLSALGEQRVNNADDPEVVAAIDKEILDWRRTYWLALGLTTEKLNEIGGDDFLKSASEADFQDTKIEDYGDHQLVVEKKNNRILGIRRLGDKNSPFMYSDQAEERLIKALSTYHSTKGIPTSEELAGLAWKKASAFVDSDPTIQKLLKGLKPNQKPTQRLGLVKKYADVLLKEKPAAEVTTSLQLVGMDPEGKPVLMNPESLNTLFQGWTFRTKEPGKDNGESKSAVVASEQADDKVGGGEMMEYNSLQDLVFNTPPPNTMVNGTLQPDESINRELSSVSQQYPNFLKHFDSLETETKNLRKLKAKSPEQQKLLRAMELRLAQFQNLRRLADVPFTFQATAALTGQGKNAHREIAKRYEELKFVKEKFYSLLKTGVPEDLQKSILELETTLIGQVGTPIPPISFGDATDKTEFTLNSVNVAESGPPKYVSGYMTQFNKDSKVGAQLFSAHAAKHKLESSTKPIRITRAIQLTANQEWLDALWVPPQKTGEHKHDGYFIVGRFKTDLK